MRSFRVAATLMLLSIPVVFAAERPLRFGSLAPANSLWDKALKQMAVEWGPSNGWSGAAPRLVDGARQRVDHHPAVEAQTRLRLLA